MFRKCGTVQLLGMTNKSKLIQEEIKKRLNLGNACYYSVQNLLSSSLLPKNIKNRIYKNIMLPVVLYGCETWSLTIREEQTEGV
jgi:ABC-type sulfate transport system substrate-binding protein